MPLLWPHGSEEEVEQRPRESTTTLVAKNRATANVSFGIRTNLGAVDGGGNKATANGDGNCLGFVCN